MTNIISNPADRQKIKDALDEVANSMTRISAEKDLIKDIIKDLSEEYEISKKILNKMARVYYKQNFKEEVQTHEDFEVLYENVTAFKETE